MYAGGLASGLQSAGNHRAGNSQLALTSMKYYIHGLIGTCIKPTELNSPIQLYPAFVNPVVHTLLLVCFGLLTLLSEQIIKW